MDRKMLPVGLDNFEKIRQIGYYYIDTFSDELPDSGQECAER